MTKPTAYLIFALCMLPAPVLAAEPHTAAAVIAADDAWGDAEIKGDAAFVDGLLLDGYVSVGPDGKVHTKAMIVESARKAAASPDPTRAAKTAEWRAAHPYRNQVAMYGDTAVLSFVSTKPASADAVNSSDIFVYRDGRWHAVYSQHSAAS